MSLFIIKFTCDKPKVTTTLIVYGVFQQGYTWENNNKFTKISKVLEYSWSSKTSKEKKWRKYLVTLMTLVNHDVTTILWLVNVINVTEYYVTQILHVSLILYAKTYHSPYRWIITIFLSIFIIFYLWDFQNFNYYRLTKFKDANTDDMNLNKFHCARLLRMFRQLIA